MSSGWIDWRAAAWIDAMHITTLVELLEQDLGRNASTRWKLAELMAERGDDDGAATQARLAHLLEKSGRERSNPK
jgi:hypothetical protein